jgi:hypothetical protein
MIRPAAILVLLSLAAAAPTPAQKRWERMDYGPFLSSSVTMPWATNGEDLTGITLKAVTIKLGTNASVCFDTGLLRYAGGWTGGWLSLYGTPFDGTHRPPKESRPAAHGDLQFMTKAGPGAAKDRSFTDPRSSRFAVLPEDWAKWRGLYVNGNHVVLSYTVGGCRVLELPGVEYQNGRALFTRTFRVGPSRRAMQLLLCERDQDWPTLAAPSSAPEGITLFGDLAASILPTPRGARLENRGNTRLVLELPPRSYWMVFKTVVGPAEAMVTARFDPRTIVTPAQFTNAGPARFPQRLITRGKLGATGGPYEVDTLTLPDDNPWHSWMRIGGFDFFEDGTRAALCTWSGDVWTVSGVDDKLQRLEWRRIATGLFQPLGLKIVDGEIYVLGRDQITRLHDLNNDGEADFYENFNNDCEVTANFHEFACDLHTDRDGNFYFTKAAPLLGTDLWDPVGAHNGSVLRVSWTGRTLERYATGLRAPNGSSVGPNREVTCSDNEGIWTPVCRLNWVKPGGFYGAVGMHHGDVTPGAFDPPLCWLPFNVDNSAGGQVWVTSRKWGPFAGELLHLSYGKCALFHVVKEEVEGVMQGGVVRFPLSFESGIMRGRFNPRDGQLYVGGLKGWQTSAARDGCLQRVRYTGKRINSLAAFHVRHDELELTFTTPLDRAMATDAQNYSVQQWNYRWSKEYGSDLYSVSEPNRVTGKKGDLRGDEVPIQSTRLSKDGKTVFLGISGLQPVMQMAVKAKLKAADGAELPLEFFNTINRVPAK